MNVCVLVKLARDPDVPAGLDAGGYLPQAGTYPVMEPSALASLGVARQMVGDEGEILAITAGDAECDAILRQALEHGADRVLRVHYPGWRHASVASIAAALVEALRALEIKPSLVLCGDRSIDEGAALLGPHVAHGLSLPWTSGVASVESQEDGRLRLFRRRPRGERLEVRGSIPALLCLDPPLEPSEPPSFERIARAADARIAVHRRSQRRQVTAPRLEPLCPRGIPISVPAGDLPPSMRIWSLLWGAEEKRAGVVKEVPPGQAAEEILALLRERGVIN